MANLAAFISEKRAGRGFSLRKLAELSDVSHTEIKRIEDGLRKQPSPAVLRSISVALGVSYEEIMEVAGYVLPTRAKPATSSRIKGADDLSSVEVAKVEEYIAFLKTQRK